MLIPQVLINEYVPTRSWWLGVEWITKFMLTGVVTVVEPGTRGQLWFGTVISLLSLLMHVHFRPYKAWMCNFTHQAVRGRRHRTSSHARAVIITRAVLNFPFLIFAHSLTFALTTICASQCPCPNPRPRPRPHLIIEQVTVQLLFTYLTANLFFVTHISSRSDAGGHSTAHDVYGIAMIAANCITFAFSMFSGLHGVRNLAQQLNEARLTWPDGRLIELAPPSAKEGHGYHLFISHVWKHGQDQAAIIKMTLKSLVPNCRTFLEYAPPPGHVISWRFGPRGCLAQTLVWLHGSYPALYGPGTFDVLPAAPTCLRSVDDLEDVSLLEGHVESSDVIIIYLTQDYLSSFNCRRELVAACTAHQVHQTPILLLLETDPDKGATNVDLLRGELAGLVRKGIPQSHRNAVESLIDMLAAKSKVSTTEDVPTMVEWHREKVLMNVVMKVIIATILRSTSQSKKLRDEVEGSKRSLSEAGRAASRLTGLTHQASRLTGLTAHSGTLQRGLKSTNRLTGLTATPTRSLTELVTPLQLHLSDEAKPSADGLLLYLHEAYRDLSGTVATSKSAFDELSDRFGRWHVELTEDTGQGATQIILLCPGCFENAVLVKMMETALLSQSKPLQQSDGMPNRRKSVEIGRRISTEIGRRLSVDNGRPELAMRRQSSLMVRTNSFIFRWVAGADDVADTEKPSLILLFSTELSFAAYMSQCQDLAPQLYGIFDHMFTKWPPSELMQLAVVQEQILPPLVARPKLPAECDRVGRRRPRSGSAHKCCTISQSQESPSGAMLPSPLPLPQPTAAAAEPPSTLPVGTTNAHVLLAAAPASVFTTACTDPVEASEDPVEASEDRWAGMQSLEA